ncbi:dipeptide ABC transporter ATP-binding protein [Nocardia otitidiscaviarum]|uniref:dipeptide ABC transporter ATP-binding protein n=1 Tax=Nocardia otitidiscaviarum TaxID=1823 RepID=UPI0004A6C759|nr:ABC transporter ATP-binding protein [Nocardia otitidiscaviarum]MBF6134427.1 dipeptide ABC transporter ATP-binding protein [Nocardia otitidiscaviarum]MBF6485947.1 dipeptide ABC transporter ATP-binding protein [Nocardia otitidiscaviarum]
MSETSTTAAGPALAIDALSVTFATDAGAVRAVCEVSYQVWPGEVLAIVGESGSGKSVSSRTAIGLLPATAHVEGLVSLGGKDITAMSERQLTALRGGAISMVFQEPGAALDPLFTVGYQIAEVLRAHTELTRKQARVRAVELLRMVGLPDPDHRVDYYPHQLSGGQKQRVMIAIAIACEPKVIIADEPTTALDVTVQAEILELLRDLRTRIGSAIVLITHNMGVVADLADRVVVMREGRVVETASVDELFADPKHEYTRALLAAVPHLGGRRIEAPTDTAVLPPEERALASGESERAEPGAESADGPRALDGSSAADRLDAVDGPNAAGGPRAMGALDAANGASTVGPRDSAAEAAGTDGSSSPGATHRSTSEESRSDAVDSSGSAGALPGAGGSAAPRAGRIPVAEPVAPGARTSPTPVGGEPVLAVTDLVVEFPGALGRPAFRAVDGVSLTIDRGETLGLVGESGSGKSTIGRCVAALQRPSSGSVRMLGQEITGLSERRLRPLRRRLGFVFQDPATSLNPRMTVGDCVAEPLVVHKVVKGQALRDRVRFLLDDVQLPAGTEHRYPHELSGGQRQRASLARALVLNPDILVADEPTSALDVSVQAKVLELFAQLQAEFGWACLFISHDLAVVDQLADRIVVLCNGAVVEAGGRDDILRRPTQEYTRRLVAAVPVPDPVEQRRRRAATAELFATDHGG